MQKFESITRINSNNCDRNSDVLVLHILIIFKRLQRESIDF